jgi:hypothetical protein
MCFVIVVQAVQKIVKKSIPWTFTRKTLIYSYGGIETIVLKSLNSILLKKSSSVKGRYSRFSSYWRWWIVHVTFYVLSNFENDLWSQKWVERILFYLNTGWFWKLCKHFNHELLASCRTRKKYLKNSVEK